MALCDRDIALALSRCSAGKGGIEMLPDLGDMSITDRVRRASSILIAKSPASSASTTETGSGATVEQMGQHIGRHLLVGAVMVGQLRNARRSCRSACREVRASVT